MDLRKIHHRLVLTHEDLLGRASTSVEGLETASCPPHVKHVAQLAIDAAANGKTHQTWRAEMRKTLDPSTTLWLAEAENCMHDAGLWPWT